MAKHLQLSIDAAGFHVTPLDVAISDAVASSLTEALLAANLAEGQVHATPEIDGSFAIKTPINFSFIHTNVNVSGTYELKIVDKG